MNIINLISALTMVLCALALVIFISWEMGVVYTALCMVTYIALSQIVEAKIAERSYLARSVRRVKCHLT